MEVLDQGDLALEDLDPQGAMGIVRDQDKNRGKRTKVARRERRRRWI